MPVIIAVLRSPQFKKLMLGLALVVADLVAERMPVFLSIPGPPGCHAAKLFLNLALDEAAKAGALDRVSAILEQGIAKLKTFKFVAAGPLG